MRLKIIRVIIILSFIFIFGTLFYIQIIEGGRYFSLSKNNRIRVVPLESWRGRIFDRNGVVLADNRLSYHVMVTPQEVQDKDALFAFLASVLNKDKEKLLRLFKARQYAPFAPVIVAEDINEDQAISIEEGRYRFPSLVIQQGFRRVYPLRENSSHVLGYIGKISSEELEQLSEYGYTPELMIGKTGIERFYDRELKGTVGGIQVEVNSRGQQVRLLGFKEAVKGKDLYLTIDADIQQMADDLLAGRKGAIVVMDAMSGAILSMTSSPTYDPNIFVDAQLNNQVTGVFNDERSPILNRVIKGAYPPGSVFKVPVALAALDSKKITMHTTFNCPGSFEFGGKRFGCTHQHGDENLIQAIAHSCNVYFYHLGLMAGAEEIAAHAALLGLGKPTDVDLPYEKSGFIPSRRQILASGRRWYGGDTLNISIGQGDVLSTPLQLTLLMSTIARDGVQVHPHLLKSIDEEEVKKYLLVRKVPLNLEHLAQVKRGLRETVANLTGTANAVNLPVVTVSGKTGTAQAGTNKEDHAWFAGYVKTPSQLLAFCVFLENGGSSHNAVDITRDLLIRMDQKDLL